MGLFAAFRPTKESAQDIHKHYSRHVKDMEPVHELHVTTVYSKDNIDYRPLGVLDKAITVEPLSYSHRIFGQEGRSFVLSCSHQMFVERSNVGKELGVKSDFLHYAPHITISNNFGGTNNTPFKNIPVYDKPILIGEEFSNPLKEEASLLSLPHSMKRLYLQSIQNLLKQLDIECSRAIVQSGYNTNLPHLPILWDENGDTQNVRLRGLAPGKKIYSRFGIILANLDRVVDPIVATLISAGVLPEQAILIRSIACDSCLDTLAEITETLIPNENNGRTNCEICSKIFMDNYTNTSTSDRDYSHSSSFGGDCTVIKEFSTESRSRQHISTALMDSKIFEKFVSYDSFFGNYIVKKYADFRRMRDIEKGIPEPTTIESQEYPEYFDQMLLQIMDHSNDIRVQQYFENQKSNTLTNTKKIKSPYPYERDKSVYEKLQKGIKIELDPRQKRRIPTKSSVTKWEPKTVRRRYKINNMTIYPDHNIYWARKTKESKKHMVHVINMNPPEEWENEVLTFKISEGQSYRLFNNAKQSSVNISNDSLEKLWKSVSPLDSVDI